MKARADELESRLIKTGLQVARVYKDTKEILDEKNAEERVIAFDVVTTNVSSVAGSSSDVNSDESTLRKHPPSSLFSSRVACNNKFP